MYIDYDAYTEFGAPCVDPKRPYGNSDVIADIAEILGWMPKDWYDGNQDKPDEWKVNGNRIHKEMQTVLQILVVNFSIRPGTYVNESDYGINWQRAFDYEV
jgi:hypothetical protein